MTARGPGRRHKGPVRAAGARAAVAVRADPGTFGSSSSSGAGTSARRDGGAPLVCDPTCAAAKGHVQRRRVHHHRKPRRPRRADAKAASNGRQRRFHLQVALSVRSYGVPARARVPDPAIRRDVGGLAVRSHQVDDRRLHGLSQGDAEPDRARPPPDIMGRRRGRGPRNRSHRGRRHRERRGQGDRSDQGIVDDRARTAPGDRLPRDVQLARWPAPSGS